MDSYNDIKDNLKSIFRDEVRLYSLRGVEKSSMVLGAIVTFFIVLIILILGVVFGSIALAHFLNEKLSHPYAGYWIVAGADLLIAILLVLWVVWRRAPLMTSLFVRILVNIFKLGEDEDQ